MYRNFVIFALVGLCSGAIVPPTDKIEGLHSSKQAASSPSQNAVKLPAGYSSAQGSQLKPTQYYYPTYPEYTASGDAIPSGYEGYLVPASLLPQRNSHWLTDIATSFLPFSSQALFYGARIGAYFLHFVFVVVLGGAFTTLLCTFTPVCTINFFGLGITKSQVKEQVAELTRTYITPESVNAATVLVTRAIDKYTAMQREKNQESLREETNRPDGVSNIINSQ